MIDYYLGANNTVKFSAWVFLKQVSCRAMAEIFKDLREMLLNRGERFENTEQYLFVCVELEVF